MVIFEATAAGTAHNVAPSSPVQLLTTLVGVSVSNPPVGQATALGAGAAGLLLYAAQAGVTVETIDPSAPSQPVTFLPNLMTKRVHISLGTDGAGVINSTAADVADALATTTPQVLQLLFWAKPLSTGAGLMSVTAAPVRSRDASALFSPRKSQLNPQDRQRAQSSTKHLPFSRDLIIYVASCFCAR